MENVIVTINNEKVITAVNGDQKKSKKKGGFSFFKSALYMLKSNPNKKPKPQNPPPVLEVVVGNGNWKKIVGSMRPLHLQDNNSPAASPEHDIESVTAEQFEDVMVAPPSPSPSTYSTGTMSQYASASNLQALDDSEDEDEDEDAHFNNKPADEMIDSKADQFIAGFYAQIRRQQMDMAYRRNLSHKSDDEDN